MEVLEAIVKLFIAFLLLAGLIAWFASIFGGPRVDSCTVTYYVGHRRFPRDLS